MKEQLKLGVARADITPELGTHLYGYTPFIVANEIHDRLSVTAFCFESGLVRALFLSITVGSLKTELCNELRNTISKECKVPFSNILLCCTHTHSAPNVTGTYGWGDVDSEYYQHIFAPGVLKAAKEAASCCIPVKMGVASGESLIGINRREPREDNVIDFGQCPWGPFDPRMTVLSFRDENQSIIANIIHYGIHGTCAGANTEVSRDFSGIMIDRMEALTGGITAFFNGPEGDVGPRLTNGITTSNSIQYAEELGGIAASDAMRIFHKIDHWEDALLSCYDGEIKIPLNPRISLEEAEKALSESEDSEVNSLGQIRNYYRNVIKSYKDGDEDQSHFIFQQSILKLGHIAFVVFPYELFSEIGMRINQYCKEYTVLSLSNANGTYGYFPTDHEISRGGYEIVMYQTKDVQTYAKNADYHLITETLKNLKED